MRNSEIVPARWYSLDSDAEWQNPALQTTAFGWTTRAIGGFDVGESRALAHLPGGNSVENLIGLGRRGEKSALPPSAQGPRLRGRLSRLKT